jgi:hypothetical protein
MDVWEPYLDSLDKYIPAVPSVVMVNEDYEDHGRHKFCLYDETKNYCDEYIRCLTETVSTKYFLYMQEDFILYDHVDTKALQRYTEFLDAGSCSFVRLIRCGDVTQTCVADDLYWITEPSSSHASVNSFSMQPTIWNTERFIELYRATKKQRFGESASFAENMNRLSISGVYAYNGEPMRKNSQHYDSSVFPYIATAVVGGRWNITEYSDELRLIFEKYEINPNARGIR